MLTLGLDTTTKTASVALLSDGALLGEYQLSSGNTHSRTLLPMVEHLLCMLEISPGEIDLYACAAGPGSFTGVRIGAATVKGLAFAQHKPCVPVSTLEALAYPMRQLSGVLCPVLDARRGHVFSARFAAEGGALRRLTPDEMISLEELSAQLTQCGQSVWLAGDAYDLAAQFTDCVTPEPLRRPSAAAVAACGEKIYRQTADKSLFDAERLTPIYLRLPQAQRELEARLAANETKNTPLTSKFEPKA